ncbi:MAG: hypothetical protein FD122_3533 [Stygiobacter sp.]|nr:MAG: hypothetical protein FD122_3533 [Stygiobacter sp.]KAF0214864.1 MAG: hypothetical protein FD178_2097 [Ignavibacteria bacterium]
MAKLYTGTCGWKYDSWRGLVYSHKEEINHLKEYSECYDAVEVQQWYFSLHGNNKVVLPKPEMVTAYKNSVHKDFKFSIKIPNSITLTHLNHSENEEELIPNGHFLSNDLLEEFVSTLKPLRHNLGVLIFQFEYFSKQKMKSQIEFQGLLREFIAKIPGGFRFAIETHNPAYLNEDYFLFLRDSKIAHVFLQGYDMPDIFDLHKRYKDYVKDYAVIRLQGEDKKGIETRSGGEWNKIIEPKDDELLRLVEMIGELLERNIDVYLSVNNHYEGSAPLTIAKIQKLMRGKSN